MGWYGVYCNDFADVIELDLSDNNMTGSIPKSLNDLTELRRIIFSSMNPTHGYKNPNRNNVHGNFPSLDKVLNLEDLEISGTDITTLHYIHLNGATLQTLSCTDGKLHTLPKVLSGMPKLEILDLSRNRMTTSSPATLEKTCRI